ncbi:unnamed protein product [marine sediment metagenome]|uniref:Arsenical-resistance protein n=1 Tax=marine sediment metagenome TaxID=412755 RepID=X0SA45_9ZZZZ
MRDVPSEEGSKLQLFDRFLTIWIFFAMAVWVGIGAVSSEVSNIFDKLQIDTFSLPLAFGLLWMIYPSLAKVRYEELSKITKADKMFSFSLFLNQIVSPFLMFGRVHFK